MSVYDLVRPILFQFDAETIHRAVMSAADIALAGPVRAALRPYYTVDDPRLRTRVFGIDFPNPVGLAAGFDKNAEHVRALQTFGFGHIEIGTVTGEGQPGNDRPRLFRLPDDEGLLNRMGFNNQGSAIVSKRLEARPPGGILGVNIGKTKKVALEDAVADYEKSFRSLYSHASYFVVNVSSPNTPGLRELQSKEPLLELLCHLQEVNHELGGVLGPKPLLVKIAPDLTYTQILDVLEVIEERDLDGIVATNTTIERDTLKTPGQQDLGSGGVSGRPLTDHSLEVVRYIHRQAPELPIVGVGGIFDATDALAMIAAGASLVQVWTGFIYRGPGIVRDINRGLLEACNNSGWAHISEASSDPRSSRSPRRRAGLA
jgi:dihydroorotate dehydrogenase